MCFVVVVVEGGLQLLEVVVHLSAGQVDLAEVIEASSELGVGQLSELHGWLSGNDE